MYRQNRPLALLLALVMVISAFALTGFAESIKAGTYHKTVNGMNGPISVDVVVGEGKVESINVTEHMETPGIGSVALEKIAREIVEKQSLDVDTLSGATITSMIFKGAVKSCLEEANADMAAWTKPVEREKDKDQEYTADVVIVGAGGAGLTAALTAAQAGASVILIEKTGIVGGNSIVAGGFYNTPDADRQDHDYQAERSAALDTMVTDALAEKPVSDEHKALQDKVREDYEAYLKTDKTLFDSPNWFALQTWNGGDKLGLLPMVNILADNALDGLHWLESMGMKFAEKVHHGGGAMYPRSHQAVLPNGTGYIKALTDTIEGNSLYTLLLNTEGKSLILDGDKVVGVNAVGRDGNAVVLKANKGVILATGGFAGNIELRQKYCEGEKWPNLGKDVGTTNVSGVTGDGIFMAAEAGANLVNMDQLQILPYCNPQTGMLNDNPLGIRTNIFVNKEGKRFVREDGRRDEMSLAIMKQTDGIMYNIVVRDTPIEEGKTLGGQPLTYLIENNISEYTYVQNIEEAAAYLKVDADVLRAEIEAFDKNVADQKVDQFGRASYNGPMGEGPFLIYARKTAAHHTMGGVEIDANARALKADGSIVKGLYCAGEITGVIHGANRVGGNAIVDYIVFGRIAGAQAAKGE